MTDLPDIINWRRVDGQITTSGQPTEAQLADIQNLGVTHIVNLGPHTNKGALADEPASVAALGMTYVFIPVDFENPTQDNFDQFQSILADLAGKPSIFIAYITPVSQRFFIATNRHRRQPPSAWNPFGDRAVFGRHLSGMMRRWILPTATKATTINWPARVSRVKTHL